MGKQGFTSVTNVLGTQLVAGTTVTGLNLRPGLLSYFGYELSFVKCQNIISKSRDALTFSLNVL